MMRPGWRRRVVIAAGVAATSAYCWVAAGLRPFTAPMEAAVGAAIGLMAVVAVVGRRRPPVAAQAGPGSLGWAVLAAVLAAWELRSYVSSPRRDNPTLSSLAGTLLDSHPGRAALIGAWLVLGWALFLRRAAPADPEPDR